MDNSSYKSNIRNSACNLLIKILDDNKKCRQIEKNLFIILV